MLLWWNIDIDCRCIGIFWNIDEISTLFFENIDIDKENFENIDIDIDKDNLKNIDIDIHMAILENIDIDMAILENIDIDISKGILQNIDIEKILYRLGFGISNTPNIRRIPNCVSIT